MCSSADAIAHARCMRAASLQGNLQARDCATCPRSQPTHRACFAKHVGVCWFWGQWIPTHTAAATTTAAAAGGWRGAHLCGGRCCCCSPDTTAGAGRYRGTSQCRLHPPPNGMQRGQVEGRKEGRREGRKEGSGGGWMGREGGRGGIFLFDCVCIHTCFHSR